MRKRMDWRSVKFDWNRARAFLVTAEEGSLSAAARALGMTQPTLGRQVSSLESELGVALFERGGRGLELTPSGLDLLEHVRAMGAAATRLSLTASGQSQTLEGNICITATEAVAAFILPDIIGRLRQAEPGIQVELIASNATSDLKRREADIAVRAFRPTQPELIAKRLGNFEHYLYASPAYLERLGNPTRKADLGRAQFVGFSATEEYLAGLNGLGLSLTMDNFPISTDSHLVHWRLAQQGVAIGIMPTYVGDRDPTVRRVLPDMEPLMSELWLVAHRELRSSRRVRTVFDFLAAELAATL